MSEEKHALEPDSNEGGFYFRAMRVLISNFARIYFRIEFHGFENVPTSGAYIVAPNHQSFFDPFWVSIPFPTPLRYMTWDKFVRMPILGHFIRSLGAFPVKLEKGDRTAMRAAAEHLRKGGRLMIFPEGGRTRDGELAQFKPGVIRLAMDTGVPIIPATIIGGYEAYGPHMIFPLPRKVKIVFHPQFAFPPSDCESISKEFLLQQASNLQNIVESARKT